MAKAMAQADKLPKIRDEERVQVWLRVRRVWACGYREHMSGSALYELVRVGSRSWWEIIRLEGHGHHPGL